MSRPVWPGRYYVHGTDGPTVEVPGWAAAWLEECTDLAAQRVRQRGRDRAVDEWLLALHYVSTRYRESLGSAAGSATGTVRPSLTEPPTGLVQPLGVGDAAELIGMSTRAVRKAIYDGRLPATRAGTRWLIDRPAAETYRRNRAA